MFEITIGSRKITPPRMLRIVPLGERYIRFRPNSSTRASSGVIVAHLTPTPCSLIAFGRVERDLVVGGVALRDPEVEVEELDVEVGQDQLLLDERPDDPGHLVAVELDDRVLDLDLRHVTSRPAGAAMLSASERRARRLGRTWRVVSAGGRTGTPLTLEPRGRALTQEVNSDSLLRCPTAHRADRRPQRGDSAADRGRGSRADRRGGYAAAQVAAVAERAGVATGTVYRHFPSKADLFAQVFREASQHEVDAVAAAAGEAGESAAERIAVAVETFARRALRGHRLAWALIAEPVDPGGRGRAPRLPPRLPRRVRRGDRGRRRVRGAAGPGSAGRAARRWSGRSGRRWSARCPPPPAEPTTRP